MLTLPPPPTSVCFAGHTVGFQSLTSKMAPVSSRFQSSFLVACVLCSLISCCKSADGAAAAAAALQGQKKDATDIVGRALFCFNDRYIYSGCQGSLRLGPGGSLTVPPASTEAFCGGPCLAETELVLRCIDGVMDNFRFYNGASVGDVRLALGRGCGRTGLRGDFDVLHHLGDGGNYGNGYFYGRGSSSSGRRVALVNTLVLSAGAAILLRG